MSGSTLHQVNKIKQDTMEGKYTMQRFAFTKLINQLIRENADYRHDQCHLNVACLPMSDKRLVLSHVVDSEEYEEACQSTIKTEVIFEENKKFIQKQFDLECYEVYQEYTEEMRAYK